MLMMPLMPLMMRAMLMLLMMPPYAAITLPMPTLRFSLIISADAVIIDAFATFFFFFFFHDAAAFAIAAAD